MNQDIAPTPKATVYGLHVDIERINQVGLAIELCKQQLELAQPHTTMWKANVWPRNDGYRVEVESW